MVIPAVRIASKKVPADAAIIFVHGLGDSGSGWSFFADFLHQNEQFRSIRFVFPNAPTIPITVNGGYRMPGWFDIYDFGNPNAKQDESGFLKSTETIKALIKEQTDSGIQLDRIIIGGFSQGAAVSLATVSLMEDKIGGVVALSGFCPVMTAVEKLHRSVNDETPIFQGHGDQDQVVNYGYGKTTAEFYKKIGHKKLDFRTYRGLQHSTTPEELDDVLKFISAVLK